MAGVAVASLVMAACGGGASGPDDASGEGDAEGDGARDWTCDPTALDAAAADGPVELRFWYSYGNVIAETFEEMVDQFNSSQDEVVVTAVNQAGEEDIMAKLIGGRESGDLPGVAVLTDIDLQRAIDAELSVPLEPCIDAASFDTSGYMPQALNYYQVEGTQQALPFNTASPVLIYNKAVFDEAGLDPEDPPETLDELEDMSSTIQDAGFETGFALERSAWYFEQWVALAGGLYVDNGNGREGRAGAALFGEEAGREIFGAIGRMLDEDSMITTQQGELNHLTGLGEGSWGMTVSSSSALGGVLAVLEGQSEDYNADDFGVAPMPGQTADGGTAVGGGALHVISPWEDVDPVQQAAAWRFIEWLSSPENNAFFAAQTGYLPVSEAAASEQVLVDRWAEAPELQVAYDQLLSGADNEATAGAVVAQMRAVREEVQESWRLMDQEGMPADEAFDRAVESTDEILEDYNASL